MIGERILIMIFGAMDGYLRHCNDAVRHADVLYDVLRPNYRSPIAAIVKQHTTLPHLRARVLRQAGNISY